MEMHIVKKHIWNKRPQEEFDWAKEKIAKHGHITEKMIRLLGLNKEYSEKFHREVVPALMYSWFARVENPELARERARNYASGKIRNRNSNSRLLPKDKANLDKADYLLYVEDRVLGFDSIDMVKAFIKDNTIISGDVKIFKKVPITIKYDVEIGV